MAIRLIDGAVKLRTGARLQMPGRPIPELRDGWTRLDERAFFRDLSCNHPVKTRVSLLSSAMGKTRFSAAADFQKERFHDA